MGAVQTRITVGFSFTLEPVDYFIEPGGKHHPSIQVRSLRGYVEPQGHISLTGEGKQMLVSGAVGNADRHAYSVHALPEELRTRILTIAQQAVAEHAAKFVQFATT